MLRMVLNVTLREVLGAPHLGQGRRREAERRRIEQALVLPDVRLAEPLPAAAEVPQRGIALRPGVAHGDAVVLPEQEVAGRHDAVHRAELRVARLAAVVPRVARHEALLRRDHVIEARRHRVEVVGARVLVDVVLLPGGVGRLVRRRVVAQDLLRDRVDPVGRDDVAGERLPHDGGPGRNGAGQRIVDQDALPEQRREIAVAHRLGRHGRGDRLREAVVEPFHRAEEERTVVPVVEPGDDDRPAEREAGAIVAELRLRPLRRVSGRSRSPPACRSGRRCSPSPSARWSRSSASR